MQRKKRGKKNMWVRPENEKLQYSGRIDHSSKSAPVFVYPCTSVRVRFSGDGIKVWLRNRHQYWDNYMGYIADGKQGKFRLEEDTTPDERTEGCLICGLAYEIPLDPQRDVHDLLLFKRQDSCHEVTFLGFEIENGVEVLELPPKPQRRIEVYGDSVSAGEVSEAVEYTGKPDPEHNGQFSNCWYSYAWMTARKLNAQIHDVAQGGIALLDGTGWFNGPDYVGMETAWDKIHYNPAFGPATVWDFKGYIPQVVIVAIGQNDSHPEDYMKEDHHCGRALRWRRSYKALLEKIRGQYPDAWIVCITTLLEHDPAWDQSIDEVCRGMQDEKVRHFLFARNGRGTPGHLRVSEAEEMSEELTAYIESLGIDW